MKQTNEFHHGEDEIVQVLEMPYERFLLEKIKIHYTVE